MTQSVLIKCPCCNSILTITVTCDSPPEDKAKDCLSNHDPLGIKADTERYKEEMVLASTSLEKFKEVEFRKMEHGKKEYGLSEEEYITSEIRRLGKAVNDCKCNLGEKGICQRCDELSRIANRLKQSICIHVYVPSVIDIPLGIIETPVRCRKCGHEEKLTVENADKLVPPVQGASVSKDNSIPCPHCKGIGGTGSTCISGPCPVCNGQGRVWKLPEQKPSTVPKSECPSNHGDGNHRWLELGTLNDKVSICLYCMKHKNVNTTSVKECPNNLANGKHEWQPTISWEKGIITKTCKLCGKEDII